MKGPKGEWRPDDPVRCAVHVARIATGQAEEVFEAPRGNVDHAAASRRASKTPKARAAKLSPERCREIAAAGVSARLGS